MPSLEVNGPELQALDAIRSFIVPLIDSSIAEGIKNAKSLAVQNSLGLLRFELHSLTFWITKGHELKDQEYEAFLQDLQPVLQLLEDFIHPQAAGLSKGGIPDPTSSNERRRYPKLHAIIQKASQSKDQLDLKAAIILPDSGDAATAACEIVTKFNANNQDETMATTASQSVPRRTRSRRIFIPNTLVYGNLGYAHVCSKPGLITLVPLVVTITMLECFKLVQLN
ncbi:hypothetical protein MRS44_016729 [Fusarium solani]|jgi:hypothetical protein|uniref:Uncharacterized protein n=1 Tax=Fusarium solani TaxID=169388 RepID=A0A9P9HC34_FUSSL|nr:uncharacterized protein B0J15DRAFT_549160 [Fusarium solani]KAH7254600.1 hypothetical protein B0J15DRAFT_549160 [Fusarium solani]KAJ3456706.1 hypothetical protein MRS44_016729 [Fusarium solani]